MLPEFDPAPASTTTLAHKIEIVSEDLGLVFLGTGRGWLIREKVHICYVWLRFNLRRNISTFLKTIINGFQRLGTRVMCWSLSFSARFFPYVLQFWETYFLRVSMRSQAAVGSGGAGCCFAASFVAGLASSSPSIPPNDRVHITVSLIAFTMK